MLKQDSKQILLTLRELAKKSEIISTFLKVAEIEARLEMVGEKVSQEFLDETIINTSIMRDMIISIINVQTDCIQAMKNEISINKTDKP